jgi:hypothetical protein
MNDFKNFTVNGTYWSSLFLQIVCNVPYIVKGKGSHNRHGVAQRVPGGLSSQIS